MPACIISQHLSTSFSPVLFPGSSPLPRRATSQLALASQADTRRSLPQAPFNPTNDLARPSPVCSLCHAPEQDPPQSTRTFHPCHRMPVASPCSLFARLLPCHPPPRFVCALLLRVFLSQPAGTPVSRSSLLPRLKNSAWTLEALSAASSIHVASQRNAAMPAPRAGLALSLRRTQCVLACLPLLLCAFECAYCNRSVELAAKGL